jgi:hypothetical protein
MSAAAARGAEAAPTFAATDRHAEHGSHIEAAAPAFTAAARGATGAGTRLLRRAVLVLLWFALCAGADVIVFRDGKCDEGYISLTGGFVTVRGRDGRSEYTISTSVVARIEFDRWFRDLGEQARRASAGAPITVATTQSVVSVATGAVLRQLQLERVNLRWLRSFMTKDGARAILHSSPETLSNLALIVGMLLAFLTAVIATIYLIIDAFKHSILWGVLCFFCNIALLIYLFTQYQGPRARMFLYLTAPVWWALLTVLVHWVLRMTT